MTYRVTGTLTLGVEPGTVAGELRDDFGVVFVITGTRTLGGYALEGVPGPCPEGCKLPWEEDAL